MPMLRSFRALLFNALPDRVRQAVLLLVHPERAGFIYNPTYNEDGLATYHVCHFMQDERFMHAFGHAVQGIEQDYAVHWRAYIACWAAWKASSLDGDFVECGVDKGVLSRAIVDYVDFGRLPKTFYLVDTYAGIPLEYVSGEEMKLNDPTRRDYTNNYDLVKDKFSPFPNVRMVRGKVPDVLPEIQSDKIAYLSIDMNNAYPEIAAAEYFWDKMVSGAVMVLDDYAYHESYRIQRQEFDAFATRKGVQVLTLPTGQGLIFKP